MIGWWEAWKDKVGILRQDKLHCTDGWRGEWADQKWNVMWERCKYAVSESKTGSRTQVREREREREREGELKYGFESSLLLIHPRNHVYALPQTSISSVGGSISL